jgi:hypothetical protein
MSTTHTVINRAIGAGLFAAGVGLCVVFTHAPSQSAVEVAADSADNTVSHSTIGRAFSIVGGEGLRVGIGDPSDGVSAPFGGAGLDDVGIADEDPRRGVGDPSDGVSAPFGGVGSDVGIGDPADGVSAPLNRTPSGA